MRRKPLFAERRLLYALKYEMKLHRQFILISHTRVILNMQSGRNATTDPAVSPFFTWCITHREPPYPPYKQRLRCECTAAFVMHGNRLHRESFIRNC